MPEADGSLSKDLSQEDFLRFRDWINHHAGIYLEEQKTDSLRISLVTRATRFGFSTFDEYYKMLTNDDAEFRELMNLITINETSFFRFPAQFDALRDKVIPEILESKPNASRQFRVWSAGCSTGEEPYTIAMTLLDSGLEGFGYRGQVLGTDVSTNALNRARDATYPNRAFGNLDQATMHRFFEPVKDGFRVVKRVRDVVDFQYHNLIKEPYPLGLMSNWDVVFCRNVTIYFKLESTRRVVHNFFESLNPGGYLFIGHSETLTSISDEFEPVEIDGVFLYRKPKGRRLFTFEDVMARREPPRRRPAETPDRKRAIDPGEIRRQRREAVEQAAANPETETVADLLERAHELLDRGEPAEAVVLAERALRADAENMEARLVAAFAHADTGDFDRAAREATEALAVNPLLAPARYILGIIYQRQGDTFKAMNEFKRTLYIDKDFVLAHFSAANIHRSQGALDDACREYENTLRSLDACPDGQWTAFLGGFRPDLLAQTCERSLVECRKGGKAG
jgi:chemotaxis protein methyltransferase CheR